MSVLHIVKPKERSFHFPEHEKILQTTLENYVNRVSISSRMFSETEYIKFLLLLIH